MKLPLAGFKLYFPERDRTQPKLRPPIDFLQERRIKSGSAVQQPDGYTDPLFRS
jgi:hypothetical protein